MKNFLLLCRPSLPRPRWKAGRARNTGTRFWGVSRKAQSCYACGRAWARSMGETTINVVDALRGQQEQLRRLIAQKMWIREAPKATLSQIESHVTELKRLLAQLESDIQDRLKRG
jgi:hypothetical protein